MDTMKVYRCTLWLQSSYIFITAIWALLDIESFMIVTGYKTDIWLVKTVAVLLLGISITLFSHLYIPSSQTIAGILAVTTGLGLTIIDFYYSAKNLISPIYMLDGFIEICFLLIWAYILFDDFYIQRFNDMRRSLRRRKKLNRDSYI